MSKGAIAEEAVLGEARPNLVKEGTSWASVAMSVAVRPRDGEGGMSPRKSNQNAEQSEASVRRRRLEGKKNQVQIDSIKFENWLEDVSVGCLEKDRGAMKIEKRKELKKNKDVKYQKRKKIGERAQPLQIPKEKNPEEARVEIEEEGRTEERCTPEKEDKMSDDEAKIIEQRKEAEDTLKVARLLGIKPSVPDEEAIQIFINLDNERKKDEERRKEREGRL